MRPMAWNPLKDALKQWGASQDVIDYLESVEDKTVQSKLANAFRKGEATTVEQLQAKFEEFKPQRDMELETLTTRHSMHHRLRVGGRGDRAEKYWNWFLSQLKSAKRMRTGFYMTLKGLNGIDEQNQTLADIENMVDWILHADPELVQLSQMNMAQALNAGFNYVQSGFVEAPLKYGHSQVAYTFKNGWHIENVHFEDLTVEGDKMRHCVGGNDYVDYENLVRTGAAEIYSLRDPENEPHVTIEIRHGSMDGKLPDIVIQIKGNANSKPKAQYMEMVKEWLESGTINARIGIESSLAGLGDDEYNWPTLLERVMADPLYYLEQKINIGWVPIVPVDIDADVTVLDDHMVYEFIFDAIAVPLIRDVRADWFVELDVQPYEYMENVFWPDIREAMLEHVKAVYSFYGINTFRMKVVDKYIKYAKGRFEQDALNPAQGGVRTKDQKKLWASKKRIWEAMVVDLSEAIRTMYH